MSSITEPSVTETIKLIKACKDAGISEFELGALKFKLGVSEPVGYSHPKNEMTNAVEKAEQDIEAKLELLKAEDPLAYEAMMTERLAQG